MSEQSEHEARLLQNPDLVERVKANLADPSKMKRRRSFDYALEAEAKFTPGLRVREVLEHGDEIAAGLRKRCEETVTRIHQGVVCSPADVMFLIDAYREARALIDGFVDHSQLETTNND